MTLVPIEGSTVDVVVVGGAGSRRPDRVLVRTGKHQQRTLDYSEEKPDHGLGSFADLPALLDS